MARKPKVALVLGAGTARGLAHIGVLQVLLENEIPFDMIVGSSMGAMVGSIYACGVDMYMLDKMMEIMNTSVLFDVGVTKLGFMSGNRLSKFLDMLTKKKNFDDLDLPVTVVATDLVSGQRILIEDGSISEAVRASISLPGIFAPVMKEQMMLVDGAVIARLPVEVARMKQADLIIAVDVTYGPGQRSEVKNTMDVILTSLDIMAKHQFEAVMPYTDILIQPAVGHISPRQLDKSREIVDLGRKAAQEKIVEIRSKIAAFAE